MTVQYIIENINGHDYIGGWYPGGDYNVPDHLINETAWLDEYGNWKWELLNDGTVAPANIVPTQDQINTKIEKDRIASAAEYLLRTIVRAIRTTGGPAASWQAIDADLRGILT